MVLHQRSGQGTGTFLNRVCLAVLTARMSPETDMRNVCTDISTEQENGRLCKEVAGSMT